MLSPENKERLRKYEKQIKMWINDKSISLDLSARTEIESIIRTVEPGYTVMWWCTDCVGKMLEKADKYLNHEG